MGFIADEIEMCDTRRFENIVMENDEGIKQLNYVKLSSVLSFCVREQQQKIEWLESSVDELIEDVKELKGKKKPKAKNKG